MAASEWKEVTKEEFMAHAKENMLTIFLNRGGALYWGTASRYARGKKVCKTDKYYIRGGN